MLEDRADHLVRLLVLGRRLRPEVDALEHEGPQRQHRLPHLRRLADVVHALRRSTMSWTSVSIRFEPVSPEDRDLLVREVVLGEQPVAHGVVDVVVDVRDAIDEPHDLPLEGLGLPLARVRKDAVAHLRGEVERARDPQ